jgi:hypothetical protein
MHPRIKPSPRLAPLPPKPELEDVFAVSAKVLGFIANSMLIMQRGEKGEEP